MADFRKWLYAFAGVALLAGFTPAANAQTPPFSCTTSVSVAPIVRAEGYTELVGDLVLNCTGGRPTVAGQVVPQVNITVFLNTNVTSRVLAANLYNEALLLIDEPNSPLRPTPNPILNCGRSGAPDTGVSGPAVCSIMATTDPSRTYDGRSNGFGGTGFGDLFSTNTCNGSLATGNQVVVGNYGTTNGNPVANSYGCGRPNVFQGRMGTPQNSGQLNAVTFLGVPLDPPGTTTNRTLRITNIRANAVNIGVSTTFTTAQIQANISVNGPTTLTISNPQQIVAYVNRGLTVSIPAIGSFTTGGTALRNRLDLVQCNPENPDIYSGTSGFTVPSYNGGTAPNTGSNMRFGPGGLLDLTPLVRFTEGFASSWKYKNLSFGIGAGDGTTAGNATYSVSQNQYLYNGNRNYPFDIAQNVPGAVYNTESGFEWNGRQGTSSVLANAPPSPNPPVGYGFQSVPDNGTSLRSDYNLDNLGTNGTSVHMAGVANQGTRLALTLNNVPSGAGVWLAPILYLYRANSVYATSPQPNPTVTSNTASGVTVGASGVMVLTSTDTAGAGAFSIIPSSGSATRLQKAGTLAVYEILYSDPYALEVVDVPTVVAYAPNLTQNLPTPGITTTAVGGFAPFYTSVAAGQPTPNAQFTSPTAIPRFTPGSGPLDLFLISKCACNLLFPYVVSAGGYDTGIAIANSSSDPGPTFGFFGTPQNGNIQFWYYGVMANNSQVPGTNKTTKVVNAGTVLTWTASTGSPDYGLDGRAAGLIGYVITQSEFQYCHAFAYISALGAGPLTPGMSTGYLGIQLDTPGLNRTNQLGENKAH